ncbi:hypothetical protein IT399_00305 [Candidatus Nomurabacteria bacterium]|nr:hypothetical protein [Candidatus Nomurabacteria bacterium]
MKKKIWIFLIIFASLSLLSFSAFSYFGNTTSYNKNKNVAGAIESQDLPLTPKILPLDIALYDKMLNELANNPPDPIVYETIKVTEKDANGKDITKNKKVPVSPQPTFTHLWPVKTVYPNAGAILPFNRIIAYYGNLYSTKMGVLGEYPEAIVFEKLKNEVKKWEEADPSTPVIPALHYIAVVAQGSAGDDGKYRARMPYSEIDKVLAMAEKINAIVFLDIQVGFSTVEKEIPLLEKYLKMSQVHLALDPEFSMKGTIRPGKVVGTLDAADINFASNYLANLVKENNLTPKILMVHRYTQKMVTNYKLIKTLPEVQIIMHMDGWGGEAKKINTYQQFIYKEPVQFTGFKLFYKNDVFEKGTVLMSPEKLLKLNPRPVYIQFQ